MTTNSYESIRSSLLPAQDRCIAKFDELVFQARPTSSDIEHGIRLIDEFKQIHFDAISKFVANSQSFPGDKMADMLIRSQTILTQMLLSLEDVLHRNRSRR